MSAIVVLETNDGSRHLARFEIEVPEGSKLPSILKWGERYFELFDTDGVYRETRFFYDVPK